MADLSELACDDWALAHSGAVTPHAYAEVLLGLAADRRRPLVPAAVSRRSGLGVRVRHILEEAEPLPRTGTAWSTLVAGLFLGLAAALALAQTRQARATVADRPAAEDEGERAAPPKSAAVEGIVRGPGGEPLRGAEVFWIGEAMPVITHSAMPRTHPDYGKRRMKVLAQAPTDDRGHFALEARVSKPTNDGPWSMLVAHKAGFAPCSAEVPPDGRPVDVRLEPPVRIAGRLLGPGGDPAVGVRVRLDDYSEGRSRFPERVRAMGFGGDVAWESRPAFCPDDFRTDDAGRFVIDGLVPADVFARLLLTHPDHAVEEITVSTGPNTEPTPELAAFSIRPVGRDFVHTLAPARPVAGRITDAETKRPLADVRVEVVPMRKHGGRVIGTVTDAEGRYRVSDREGETYNVAAYPAAGSGYLPARRGTIKWGAGEAELRVDLALRRGVAVRGRVVDEETGKPVPSVSVVYQPRRGNPHARGGDDDLRSPVLTDAQGRFAMTALRGPGVIVAEAPSGDYRRLAVAPVDFGYTSSLHVHGLARLEVPEDGDSPEVVIGLRKGFTLEARAVRPDGSTLKDVRAWCPELTSRLLNNWVSPGEFPDGVFRLPGAEPGRTYRVFFLDRDETLGGVAELKADPQRKDPERVTLRPTATIRGRILDTDGMPLQGAQILVNIQLVDKGSNLGEQDRFDGFVTQVYNQFTGEPLKQVYPAEFRFRGLIPGCATS